MRTMAICCLLTAFLLTSCSDQPVSSSGETAPAETTPATVQTILPTASPEPTPEPTPETIRTDYANFGANESGRVPILMFHKFVEAYTEKSEPNYTTTFKEFEDLLQTLYDRGFRLINLQQFLSSSIQVPAGKHPIVFTFDDGTAGQFHLMQNDLGELVVDPLSAVGILMAFTEKHPDFGIGGTFYLNMDIYNSVFAGEGTLADRFDWLIKNGFELGNHTWRHVDFHKLTTQEAVKEAVGKNQQEFSKAYDGYMFQSLSLPYGFTPKDKTLTALIQEGTYEGIAYHNIGLMAVGAEPSVPAHHINFKPEYINRVRGQGMKAVDADLTWWLERMTEKTLYVSDGDPSTVVVPESKVSQIAPEWLEGKTIVTYPDATP